MRRKVIGIVCCLAVLAVSLFAPVLTMDVKVRYHQHREDTPYTKCTTHSEDVFCTHLPLVQIDTEGEEIPGSPVRNHINHITSFTSAKDGSSNINVEIKVTDNEGNNHIADKPDFISRADIRIRGNSSRYFDKKSYLIKLVNENGENNPQQVMGMDEHHEWVLHGPYLDKSLIRNYMWYNISGEIMDYAPNVRFCEVIINGEYQGVYVMAETISAGKEGARLNLSVQKKDNTFTGYIIRVDRGSSNAADNINSFLMYSLNYDIKTDIEFPGASNLTPEMRRTIEREFSDFEKALYSYDFDSKEYGYMKYIDVDNFVDYLIINEVTCNYDAGYYSTYFYKDPEGKYRMCVWDFNNSCDNYQETKFDGDTLDMEKRPYFFMLMKSDYFTDKVIKRYKELRKTVLSDEYINNYIDETIAYLGPAIDRNFKKWGNSFNQLLLENSQDATDRNKRSFDKAVEQLKGFLDFRLSWLDENIEVVTSFSTDSKIKKFSEATE